MQQIIKVSGLKKAYGSVQAVNGIDFYVEKGKLFAFLGPNGAGKSTTIDILCTALRPDQGEVSINGHRLGKEDAAIRRSIGVVFQGSMLDPLLSVRENLITRGALYGLSGGALRQAAENAAKAVLADEFLDRPYGKLSGGQRRRADVARALVNTPEILFLDEPTTGLDPQTRASVWETVRLLQESRNITVFMTTHYMEEAARADYVMIIDYGKIAARGTPSALKEQFAGDILKLFAPDLPALAAVLKQRGIEFSHEGGALAVRLGSSLDALPILSDLGGMLSNFEVLNGTMDDVFLRITGREMRV